jgi:trehalose 6-phosphate phosphatase
MIEADPASCALYLDLDGTLIDIAAMPDGVVVPADLVQLIHGLSRVLDGALAIVTGRPIVDVDRFLAPLTPIAAGVHGAEMRTTVDGDVHLVAEPIEAVVVEAVREIARAEPGVIVELKRASIAVHYRLAPDVGPRIEMALRRVLSESHDHLILCSGRKVLEIMPRYISKGAALEQLADLPAFRGKKPIMIGDDASDETAFDAAARLGGRGLKVAGGRYHAEEATFAGPAEVRAWLSAFVRRHTT